MEDQRPKWFAGGFPINIMYYPAFLFLPREYLEMTSPNLLEVPRIPAKAVFDPASWDLISGDRFYATVQHGIAWMLWFHLMPDDDPTVYSIRDPIKRYVFDTNYWVEKMTEKCIIPSLGVLLADDESRGKVFNYISLMQMDLTLGPFVAEVAWHDNIEDVISVVEEHRCFEDYGKRNSFEKREFYRNWYHTRTRHPMVSLDQYQDEYSEANGGADWDPPDESPSFESQVNCQILADQFMDTLSEKDKQILQLRLEGRTMEEVAKRLGYATHSAVLKRLRKIGLAFEKFAGVEYGFDGRRILKTD